VERPPARGPDTPACRPARPRRTPRIMARLFAPRAEHAPRQLEGKWARFRHIDSSYPAADMMCCTENRSRPIRRLFMPRLTIAAEPKTRRVNNNGPEQERLAVDEGGSCRLANGTTIHCRIRTGAADREAGERAICGLSDHGWDGWGANAWTSYVRSISRRDLLLARNAPARP